MEIKKDRPWESVIALIVGLLFLISVALAEEKVITVEWPMDVPTHANLERFRPIPPPGAYQYSVFHYAPLEVAKVFGRTTGCSAASDELINEIGAAAARQGVDPRIVAATVAVESDCNGFAISSRGALGIMQVMPLVWKDKYDFGGSVNLLNTHDNIRVGTEILGKLIRQYGITEGVRRYQGTGSNCNTCDGAYTSKILSLAGRKQ